MLYGDIRIHVPMSMSEIGNQTLIKTETGIWSVTYNAENRPIRWESGDTVITMAFDRMGRRVEMRTVKDGEETLQRFVYDNYLCIQQLRGADNTLAQSYVWDPTEPIATRPLESRSLSNDIIYYFHDGNKNVTDLVIHSTPIVHYDYTPFGSVNQTFLSPSQSIENPFKFSSEYFDDTLGLVYYNNRHYTPLQGRFLRRDIVSDYVLQEYAMGMNNPVGFYDYVGYTSISVSHSIPLGPIPIPPLHVSLVGEVIFSGKFENCKLCNGTTPEIHFFTETSVSAKVGIRAGVAFNDGINRNGQFVHQGGKNDAKNRYRDLSGRFAKRPSTDTLKDILGLELWNQSIMPASLEDWEQLPQCPQDSISGSLSIYVQGRASVLGLGANVDLTWQLLPSDGRSWWPTFEGRKGFIGGGTALYVEAGITGTLSLTAVY